MSVCAYVLMSTGWINDFLHRLHERCTAVITGRELADMLIDAITADTDTDSDLEEEEDLGAPTAIPYSKPSSATSAMDPTQSSVQ